MNVHARISAGERRTTADDVFDSLRADIVNLRICPGSKLSEAEIALQYAVSRQPVREAFIRLNNMNLVQIRPQKATQVCKISDRDILNSRFIRTAVEVEIVGQACLSANAENLVDLQKNLTQQDRAVQAGDGELFHELDYEFHRLLCVSANRAFAFETIAESKSHVDRLCMLSLADFDSRQQLLTDHERIFEALKLKDAAAAIASTREHLSRLDNTLADAREKFPDYFED